MRVPTSGGAAQVIAGDQLEPSEIAADGVSVYWANNGDGTVRKASK